MIILPCSCGRKDCPNQVRINTLEKQVWIDHEVGGTDLLIHTSVSRLRNFAWKILRATNPRKIRST